ncbi:MAG: O-antigen ligase family protein [Verrucomicrobiota bacterium]
MYGASIARNPPDAVPADAGTTKGWKSFARALNDLFRSQGLVALLFLAATGIGFFHGWLKLRYSAGWLTYAFDVPLAVALAVTLFVRPRGTPFFPEGRIGNALKAWILVCLAYLALSVEVPFLIRLASFRGWCFMPLMFVVGYHATRGMRRFEIIAYFLVLLGIFTAYYGCFRQTEAEVREMMRNNPELERRLSGSFFGSDQGTGFRRFSTFTTPAAFGSMMAYCVLIALGRLTSQGVHWIERGVLLAAVALMGYALILSGSRTASSALVLNLLVMAWYSRASIKLIFLPAILFGLLISAVAGQSTPIIQLLQTITNLEHLQGRLGIVVIPARQALEDSVIGGGLGRSGHGVPSALGYLSRTYDWRPVDGDLGRIIVDMGLVGAALFGLLVWAGLRDAWDSSKALRGTPLGELTFSVISALGMQLITWPTGSPFLGIPYGALLWFFFGASVRLAHEYQREMPSEKSAAEAEGFFSPLPHQKPAWSFLGGQRSRFSGKPGYRPIPIGVHRERRRGLTDLPQPESAAYQPGLDGPGQPASKRFLFPRKKP